MLKLNPNASKKSGSANVKYEFDLLDVEDLPEVIKEEASAHVVKFRPQSTSDWFLLCKKCSKDFTEAELYTHLSLYHEKCRKAISGTIHFRSSELEFSLFPTISNRLKQSIITQTKRY